MAILLICRNADIGDCRYADIADNRYADTGKKCRYADIADADINTGTSLEFCLNVSGKN